MCSVNCDGASPFDPLTLLTGDTDSSSYNTTVYRRQLLNLLSVSYLIPGHLRLLVWSHIVFYIRAGDHFAMGYLSLFQVADIAAEAFPLITLVHSHRHGHFHAVCRVPEQIANTTLGKCFYHVLLLTLAVKKKEKSPIKSQVPVVELYV